MTATHMEHERVLLLIEDDDNDVRIYERAMRGIAFPHRMRRARDGEEGLAIIEASSVDMILLDLNMPGMDGRTFLKALRERGDRTPVLVLTTSEAEADIQQTRDDGADAFVSKPKRLEDLAHVVSAIETLDTHAKGRR